MAFDIVPNLSVAAAASAVDFYKRAFGAVELFRVGTGEDIFAELEVEGARFFVAQEAHAFRNVSPTHLGGTTVRIDLLVDDPDTVHARALAWTAPSRSNQCVTTRSAHVWESSTIRSVTAG